MHFLETNINGIECIRKYRFEAAHREHNPRWGDYQNLQIYGNDNRIHGHNFELYVLLQGKEQEYSGMVIELSSIDDIVEKNIINIYDHTLLGWNNIPVTHELFADHCSWILRDKIPNYYGLILSESNNRYIKFLELKHNDIEESKLIYRTHILEFTAAHKLFNPNLDEENNQRIFGKCTRLHGHNYKLSVTVTGTIGNETGLLINPKHFDVILNSVCNKFDYQELHKFGDFKDIPATTENFIKIIWEDIKNRLNILLESSDYKLTDNFSKDLKLDQIVLQETERNIFIYRGE